MRVKRRGAERSVTLALLVLVLTSGAMLVITKGSVRSEMTVLQTRAAMFLGLHSVPPNAWAWMASVARNTLDVALV